MYIERVSSSSIPSAVTLEQLDGQNRVILCKDVEEVVTEEGVSYVYKRSEFILPEERSQETVESIEENFNAWWLYAGEDHSVPTLEERVSLLEDLVLL